MKNLTIAFLAAVSLMSFAGCKKKGADALGKMTEYKDLMCKCAAGDKACADKVAADYAKAMADMAGADKGEAKAPDPEEAKKYAPVMKEYTDCMMKAQGMGMTPPAGDKPAAPAGDKPAGDKPAEGAAPPAGGDKPADPAAPPAGGDKPAAGSN